MRMRAAPRAGLVLAVVVATAAPASAEVAVPSGGGASAADRVRTSAVPGVVVGPPPRARATAAGRWSWPLTPVPAVQRGFVAPATEWGSGHRGIDLTGAVGEAVLAVEGGVVIHVGTIAGRGTVSVVHRDGLRSTYEPVDALVHVGEPVSAGRPIGRLARVGGHCPSACLHLGARRAGAYLDPLPLLRPPRVILLPLG